MALGKPKPGHVCPDCSGRGYIFAPDVKGHPRQMLCGHAKCQVDREERIAAHVIAQASPALIDRAVHEVRRCLPTDIKMRGRA
jgi:uncharacterized protein (DUF983 family)